MSRGIGDDGRQVAWLRRRDEKVRSEMANLINEGYSGGQALLHARRKHEALWNQRDDVAAIIPVPADRSFEEDYARPAKTMRPGKASGKGKRNEDDRRHGEGDLPRRNPDGQWYSLRQHPGSKRQICGTFQSRKGCRNSKCKEDHVCAVVVAPGQICGSRTHGASGHQR